MEQVIRGATVAVGTAVVIAIMTIVSRHSGPLSEAEGRVTITPGKFSAWLTVLFFGAMALGGVAFVFAGQIVDGLLLFGVGSALAGFMAPSLTHVHDVSWSEEGLSGPCRTFGPTLRTARTDIPWRQVTTAGKTSSGYWYVQANDGRRIYWSFLYPGFGRLVAELRARRPGVVLPPDLGG
jgi:hypothetical protein